MSDYQNLDLRAEHTRRAQGSPYRGVLITLGVVLVLFVLLAALGSGTRDGDQAVPAGDATQTAPVAAQPAGE